MSIPLAPPVPQSNLPPAEFDSRTDAFLKWQAEQLVPGLNEFITQLNNFATSGTSIAEQEIGIGPKAMLVEPDKGFLLGMTIKAAAKSAPVNWMLGDITSYNVTTGAMTFAVKQIQGGGTYSNWVISPAVAGETQGMGAAVASAASPMIWLNDGNKRHITGISTITGFSSAPFAGAIQWLMFDDVLTITGSDDLIIGRPTYTTQAGDWAMVLAETTTRFRVIIVRKDGKALNTGVLASDLTNDIISKRMLSNSVSRKVKGFAGSGHDWTYFQMLAGFDDGSAAVWGRTVNLAIGVNQTGDFIAPPQRPLFNIPIPAGHHVVKWEKTGNALYAVISNGWVYSGGSNGYGMLGHGDTVHRALLCRIEYFVTNSINIVDVVAETSRATSEAGWAFFRNASGQIWSCGYGVNGVLGLGDTSNRNLPSPVAVISGVKKIVLTGNAGQSYLLLESGNLLGAGYNSRGQLGVGDNVNKSSFTSPSALAGINIVDIAATQGWVDSTWASAGGHILALADDGRVYAAGHNGSGQLGLGDTVGRNAFTLVPGLTDIVEIGVGGGMYGYSWAVRQNGELLTWGRNSAGQVGNGAIVEVTSPFTVSEYQKWSGTALIIVASPPEFSGKIAQIVGHSGVGLGYGGIAVLDTDGNVYLTGYDTYVISGTNAANKTRFTVATRPIMDEPGEKFVELFRSGYDQYETLFARTNLGNLYAAGYNSSNQASAIQTTASLIPGFQKVML
ncbi:hypothetical protein LG200_05140 [Methylobacillus caricis]|uniref:RCC1 domain-containing protein n=1 Tax=Methylobacillus caricis TaxID=1971611 RepID=UPI001D0010BF|nr:hypothetical protein [Methylobacillus caricis]MCB5187389.1 hypothetical protein [Methylobacillus caricis]